MKRLGISVVFCVFAFALLSATKTAAAAGGSTQCTVKSVGWQGTQTPSGQTQTPRLLWISCTDNSYHLVYTSSTVSAAACNMDIDSIKVIETMATAALLSGKPLTINWNQQSCQNGNSRIIVSAELST